MNLSLHALSGQEVLAGSAYGAVQMSKLVDAVRNIHALSVISLDFKGIEVATGSFLRECVLGFRDYCRQRQPNLYPVVANLNATVVEEFTDLLRDRRTAMIVCVANQRGQLINATVIGVLEEKQRVTLQAVLKIGETDAATLGNRYSEEAIGITTWNNRLASLASDGILIEIRKGRSKRYRPVIEGLKHGA